MPHLPLLSSVRSEARKQSCLLLKVCPRIFKSRAERSKFSTLIGNCGYTRETAAAAIRDHHADMIDFGRTFISNPDLVARFEHGWPLNPSTDMSTWYSFDEIGYTDFPCYGTPPTSEA